MHLNSWRQSFFPIGCSGLCNTCFLPPQTSHLKQGKSLKPTSTSSRWNEGNSNPVWGLSTHRLHLWPAWSCNGSQVISALLCPSVVQQLRHSRLSWETDTEQTHSAPNLNESVSGSQGGLCKIPTNTSRTKPLFTDKSSEPDRHPRDRGMVWNSFLMPSCLCVNVTCFRFSQLDSTCQLGACFLSFLLCTAGTHGWAIPIISPSIGAADWCCLWEAKIVFVLYFLH